MIRIAFQSFVVAVTAVATIGSPAGSAAAEDVPFHQIATEPDPKLKRADFIFYAGEPKRALELVHAPLRQPRNRVFRDEVRAMLHEMS